MDCWRQVRGSREEIVWELSTRYQVQGTKYQVPRTMYQVRSTKYEVVDIMYEDLRQEGN